MLMMGWGWGGVGHVNVRVKLLKFVQEDVLQEIRAKEFACPKCGLDSLLQNVAMEIYPHVQKLGESHGVQTARDVKKRCRLLRRLELV